MSIGKYSPTVSAAYANDQEWWNKNGGEDPDLIDLPADDYFNDNDGYDAYGYNLASEDRAGYTEDQYLLAGNEDHELYQLTLDRWTIDEDGFPKER